tara:strand:- start:86 stop:322 length:237 start_codon:yes stop_codon:yes gene_type:complete
VRVIYKEPLYQPQTHPESAGFGSYGLKFVEEFGVEVVLQNIQEACLEERTKVLRRLVLAGEGERTDLAFQVVQLLVTV